MGDCFNDFTEAGRHKAWQSSISTASVSPTSASPSSKCFPAFRLWGVIWQHQKEAEPFHMVLRAHRSPSRKQRKFPIIYQGAAAASHPAHPSSLLSCCRLSPVEVHGPVPRGRQGSTPAPSFSSIRTPEARKLTPLMQHLQGNLFQLPPRLLRPLASPEPMAAIPGQESFGCQWGPQAVPSQVGGGPSNCR